MKRKDIKASLRKKRMNLCVTQTFAGINTNVLMIAFLVIAVIIFGKFAVYDRLKTVSDASQNYYSSLDQLEALNLAAADYDSISEQYSRTGQNYKTAEEAALSDRMNILALIEQDTENLAEIKSISIQNNIATVTLDMEDYQNAAILRDTLAANEKVASVSSEAAERVGDGAGENTEMTLIITFADEGVTVK